MLFEAQPKGDGRNTKETTDSKKCVEIKKCIEYLEICINCHRFDHAGTFITLNLSPHREKKSKASPKTGREA